MITLRKTYLFIVAFFLFISLNAQTIYTSKFYPQAYFRPPLDLKPSLAGSFGELRKNHFHSGLDYKTNHREGYPVYATADGFVSRLKVQIGGFGNALYIDHPNGYTTVYAHLQRFNTSIAQAVKDRQYQIQSFEVDFSPAYLGIPVKKGDIIGWSGNTGSSAGPHLHFEIRDTQSEEIINPQLFSLRLPDHIKPEIGGLYVYHLNGEPFSDQTPKHYFPVVGSAGIYRLEAPLVDVSEEIGFGINAYDKDSASDNKHGVYSIDLLIDGENIYSASWDRFFFNHSRAINSHIDYPTLQTSNRWIQKSFVEPGNPLTIYKNLVDNGLIHISDKQIHEVQYLIRDIAGNASSLNFRIKYNPTVSITNKKSTHAISFKYNQVNTFNTDEINILLPKGVLYSDLDFVYSSSPKPTNAFSSIHHVHNRLTPLNDTISLWIKPESASNINLKEKLLLVNDQKLAQGGSYENGYVKAAVKTFGNFYVAIDTVAPIIIPININSEKSMKNMPKMTFKISDELSGILNFTGTIDGQWVLMEFDPKTSTLWHTFDDRTSPGKHFLQLIVTDKKANKKTYKATFFR